MQTRVQTVGTCKENSTTGGRNVRITIREKDGKLLTRRLKSLAKNRQITFVPENLLEDLVDGYNAEILRLKLPDQDKLEFKSWPEGGHQREQLIVDLLERRSDLIKIGKALESGRTNDLNNLIAERKPEFDDLWDNYDLSSRGDVSWNPVEEIRIHLLQA